LNSVAAKKLHEASTEGSFNITVTFSYYLKLFLYHDCQVFVNGAGMV